MTDSSPPLGISSDFALEASAFTDPASLADPKLQDRSYAPRNGLSLPTRINGPTCGIFYEALRLSLGLLLGARIKVSALTGL